MAVGPLPVLKITLVKFSPSPRPAAQMQKGLRGGTGQQSSEDCSNNTESRQITREKQNMCLRFSGIGHCYSLPR